MKELKEKKQNIEAQSETLSNILDRAFCEDI